MDLTIEQRQDLVTARGSLRRAALGIEDVDFDTAASMIDRVLATVCDHDPADFHTAPDVTNGRPLTTCYACGVTWYADYQERLDPERKRSSGTGP